MLLTLATAPRQERHRSKCAGVNVKRLIIAAVIGYVVFKIAMVVLRPANPSYADLAQQFCPAEWAALEAFDPPIYLQHYHDQEAAREPGTSLAANAVLHRPFVLALANVEFAGQFVSFSNAEHHTPYNLAHTHALLDLIKCLNPSETDRQTTQNIYGQVYQGEASSRLYTEIFQTTDTMFCMGYDRALTAY